MALVDDHYKEINIHVRHVAQLLVTWYTFFVTANLIAVGWFVTSDPTRVRITTPVLWSVVALFLVVNSLGVGALRTARRYFVTENQTLQDLLNNSATDGAKPALPLHAPIPVTLYSRGVDLMTASLIAIFLTWLALGLLRR